MNHPYYLVISGKYQYKIYESLTLGDILHKVPECLHPVIKDYEFKELEVSFDDVTYKIEKD